ncbi:putative MO25-like protein At5g47540 isoform X2 [Benincasa hispida]|uniref:putative MO25-like protein At5g47540 isoform X2 n=1 Tax=Benincasa hispida TaxID=102211 RepID=UPI001901A76B|nr:putative MO25-like protein At5g47540 isoform X2 [Benincasa hispida]
MPNKTGTQRRPFLLFPRLHLPIVTPEIVSSKKNKDQRTPPKFITTHLHIMKGLFKPKTRSPVELVRYAHELLLFIDRNEEVREQKRAEKMSELNKTISQMRTVLYGNAEGEPSPDACSQLTQEFFKENMFRLFIACIPKLNSGRQQVKSRIIASEYLENNMDIMDILIPGYEDSDIALTYGAIARECIRHQCVARYVLESVHMKKFFDYIQNPIFYVASDASATFRKLLTRHKSTVAAFLTKNYDWFFKEYNMQLLESTNYITKRHAVKLLGDILLDNSNSAVMVQYVSSLDNMRILMNLLRDPNKTIQRDAFDVFKLFVANKNKPPEITSILVANRTKLLRFLNDLKPDKVNEGFEEDKAQIIREISILESSDPSSSEMENSFHANTSRKVW